MDDRVSAVQRMQDYIDEHLAQEMTLSDLARVSLYSPWYSYRLFKQFTNLTPADYIRRLRLSRSALLLRDGNVRITDAALSSGFSSVDGYQRAFFREFGMNPGQYAASPSPIYLFTPFGVSSASNIGKDEKTMENVKSVFVSVIDKPERKALIKRGVKAEGYFDYCEEVGCDIWGLLVSMRSLCGEPVCMWLPQRFIEPGTSKYVQGVEAPLDYSGSVPEGFDVITLPASKYLMFQGEPFAEEDYAEAIEQVWTAIKKYDPSFIGYKWDESSPRIQLEPIGARGYVELLAVKPV